MPTLKIVQKASRSYNSFVKSEIFNRFRGTEWVMDLASGKGQDFFRYSSNNMKNIVFLEIDKKFKDKNISDSSVKMYLRNLEKLNDDEPLKNLNFLIN